MHRGRWPGAAAHYTAASGADSDATSNTGISSMIHERRKRFLNTPLHRLLPPSAGVGAAACLLFLY